MRLFDWWEKLCLAHRSDDETAQGSLREFLWPRPTKGFFIRAGVVALIALVVFGWLLTPCVIDGASMVPTYPEHGFNFCWRGRYWFSEPRRGDVVIVRHHDRVYYLKRVVALAGDTVEFRGGKLFVNDEEQNEPYAKYFCSWELPPCTVEPGHCYVVGDNRSQPIEAHHFGSVSTKRIIGAPLF